MQNVIAARDVDIYIDFGITGLPSMKIGTASSFSANITGTTDDIGAISTDEPIATDNGGTTYDVQFSLQQAEAQRLKDAAALQYEATYGTPFVHIRQLVECAQITAVWKRKRDVPATATTEIYYNCSGVEESDAVERRATETLKTWHFRARGMSRVSSLIV